MPNNHQPPIESQPNLRLVDNTEGIQGLASDIGDDPTAAQLYWRQYGPEGADKRLTEVLRDNAEELFEFPRGHDENPSTVPGGKVIDGPWTRDSIERFKVVPGIAKPRH